ncbi:MAG: DUF4421 family protein [Bacteroidaceae bacterium]|nr:DUF4421 family protein [Bacteroidaceae bacterium]
MVVRVIRNVGFRTVLCLLSVVCCLSEVHAESRLKRFWSKADSLLTTRYYRTSYDTNYVVRPEGKLTLKLKGNQTGNSLRARGIVDDVHFKSHLSTSHKSTISIAGTYRGLSAAYSINPAKLRGFYDDYELNFNFYASRFCIDASYQESSSLSGDMTFENETLRMEQGEADMKVFNITGYYVFNHRRYSVSAAYNQSYIQRRSAGSWLAGLSYQGGSIETSDERKERYPEDHDVRIYVGHVGIGGGYGYNLVLGRKWLLNLTFLPTFVVYNRNQLTINDESQHAGRMKFNMLFNERAAVVYNFSSRYFVGLTGVANNSLFVDDAVTVHQNKWVAHAFVGVRLWR